MTLDNLRGTELLTRGTRGEQEGGIIISTQATLMSAMGELLETVEVIMLLKFDFKQFLRGTELSTGGIHFYLFFSCLYFINLVYLYFGIFVILFICSLEFPVRSKSGYTVAHLLIRHKAVNHLSGMRCWCKAKTSPQAN